MVGLALLPVWTRAQDIHFSQYYMPNLWLNPAMTGFTPHPFRLVLGYRNQWQAITPYPYRTFYASLDVPVLRSYTEPNIFGLGVMMIDDRAGHSQLGTTEILVSAAYHFALGDGGSFIGVGLQGGWGQRSFETERLTFGDQFTIFGYDPNQPTAEVFPATSSSFLDVAAGFWSIFAVSQSLSLYLGGSAYHLNQPTFRFMNEHVPIYMRFLGYLGGVVDLNTQNSLVLTVVGMRQYEYQEYDVGLGWILWFPGDWMSGYLGRSDKSIMFGLWYRIGDAIFPAIRFDSRYFSAGITYDITLSSLRKANTFRGGIEIFLAFYGVKLPKREEYKRIYCPKFGT